MWKNESNRGKKRKNKNIFMPIMGGFSVIPCRWIISQNELEGFHGRQFWNPHNILEPTEEVIPRMVQKVKILIGSGGVCLFYIISLIKNNICINSHGTIHYLVC